MALRGHVFNKQLFSSECFALFIDTFLGGNSGIVKGCELSYTANSIDVFNGFFCVRGRFLQEQGGTTFNIEAITEDDLYCQLICEIDMSQENTTSELKQASYKILQSKTGYSNLLQEDITDTGTIYQFILAQFKVTENGVEDFQDKRKFLDFSSFYSEIRRDFQVIIDEINQRKEDFFTQLNITTRAQADELIVQLQEYYNIIKQEIDENVSNVESYCEDKKDEVDALIQRLKDMLQELSSEMLPAELVTVDNNHFEGNNLADVLNEIGKTRIVVSETQPTHDCIWYKVLNEIPAPSELTYELQTTEYDETKTFHLEQDDNLETITNMTEDITDENNLIVEEI